MGILTQFPGDDKGAMAPIFSPDGRFKPIFSANEWGKPSGVAQGPRFIGQDLTDLRRCGKVPHPMDSIGSFE
jgi:hypothetical protein